MDNLNDLFRITYENGISTINMVIQTKVALRFINYQYEMLSNNNCKGIMAINVRRKDEQVYLYCDITSRLTLAQYLKGRRLAKEEFVGIISSIIETILSSKGYLLYERCFLLDKDYIYIKPGTHDVQLAYLPFDLSSNADTALKKLLIDIIMASDFEEVSDDNFLQRILSNVKSETFCLNELRKLLKDISYDAAPVNVDLGYQEPGEEDIDDEKEQLKQKREVINIGWGFFAIILIQIIVCFFIFTLIKSELIKDTLTRYALCLVIIALDLFAAVRFIKKMPKSKLNETSAKEDPHTKAGLPEAASEEGPKGAFKGAFRDSFKDSFNNSFKDTHNEAQNSELLPEDATMLLTVNDIAKKEGKPPYACLQRNANGVLEEITIAKSYFTLGRLEGQVDYTCKSSAIGRVHAEITYKEGVYYIKDLNSRNGTYINNERIDSNKDYIISDKDKISFANFEYNLVIN